MASFGSMIQDKAPNLIPSYYTEFGWMPGGFTFLNDSSENAQGILSTGAFSIFSNVLHEM